MIGEDVDEDEIGEELETSERALSRGEGAIEVDSERDVEVAADVAEAVVVVVVVVMGE